MVGGAEVHEVFSLSHIHPQWRVLSVNRPCVATQLLIRLFILWWHRAAGTDCGVYVILYGSGGHSGELKLENHPQNFSRGRTGEYMLHQDKCCPMML
jgi:hypothetical protein